MTKKEDRADYDSPWKEVIEKFFKLFLEFFFPEAYADIDWEKGWTFENVELAQLDQQGEAGKLYADKVAKVWLLEKEEQKKKKRKKKEEDRWGIVHVEIQARYDIHLPLRTYQYNYRLFDRYQKPVISLVIMADERENWRPTSYRYSRGGNRNGLDYCIAKLLDYKKQLDSLEESDNPFGLIISAHLRTKMTTGKPHSRLEWKLKLVKKLYEREYDREHFQPLFRFIDWIMVLPKELSSHFRAELEKYEEAYKVRYVTSVERLAKEEGKVENAQENVIENLATRFGEVPSTIIERINQIDSLTVLKSLHKRAITIADISDFSRAIDDETNK